jgi:choline dehydrogenase-like flavoprotein
MSSRDRRTVDYIVVGGGSAGCAVARRLADSGADVLLLEAGGPDTGRFSGELFGIPGAMNLLHSIPQLHRRIDWGYRTVPQTHAWGRQIPQTRGKVLGGSSSVNGMLFVRGNRHNYDGWAAQGCEGWSYDEVLPAFKRMEDWEDGADQYRGSGGPVKVTRVSGLTGASQAWMTEAARQLEVPILDDYNGASQEGVAPFQQNVGDGRRFSASRAYLRDAPDNLSVVTGAQVVRVVIAEGRATGVEVRRGGESEIWSASREVVLSGGTYGSAHLLLLSGVGPADQLSRLGIPVHADLPVGENFHDHLYVPVSFRTDAAVHRPRPGYIARGLAHSRRHPGQGWAAKTSFETVGFVRTSRATDVPDLQLLSLHWIYPSPNQDDESKPIRPETSRPGMSVFPALIYPRSRGSIRLASPDPDQQPLIDPNYLAEPSDAETLLEGIAMVRDVMSGVPHGGEINPGPAFADPQQLRRELPNRVHTEYHPVGTCRMGVDERAVVDPQLRVRGIEGLRVADASIMPDVVGGNTNAPAIMIGEKAAAMILEAWASHHQQQEIA